MRRLNLMICMALLTVLSVGAKTKKQLVVLHTNDTHSCIMPLNTNLDNKDIAGRGGFLRRVNMLKEQRQQHPDMLLFDSGDFSQGSGFYTLFRGEVEIGLMNQMGYDAVTIGNHEFDFGLDNLAKLCRMANFPVVCSNYDFTGTPCEGLVKDYITIQRNGLKIGVYALGAPLKGLVSNKNCEGVVFLDPVEVSKKYISILRQKEKCDVVICLSHLGWKISEYPDHQFIREIEGCDLVLGGHTHTYMKQLEHWKNMDGKDVAVDQNGKSACFVGKLVVDLR